MAQAQRGELREDAGWWQLDAEAAAQADGDLRGLLEARDLNRAPGPGRPRCRCRRRDDVEAELALEEGRGQVEDGDDLIRGAVAALDAQEADRGDAEAEGGADAGEVSDAGEPQLREEGGPEVSPAAGDEAGPRGGGGGGEAEEDVAEHLVGERTESARRGGFRGGPRRRAHRILVGGGHHVDEAPGVGDDTLASRLDERVGVVAGDGEELPALLERLARCVHGRRVLSARLPPRLQDGLRCRDELLVRLAHLVHLRIHLRRSWGGGSWRGRGDGVGVGAPRGDVDEGFGNGISGLVGFFFSTEYDFEVEELPLASRLNTPNLTQLINNIGLNVLREKNYKDS